MIIEISIHRPHGPRLVDIVYWEEPIDEAKFKRKRLRANRAGRRGESRNARRARLRNKRFYDSFRPQFGPVRMPPATGKSVALQVPAAMRGYRIGATIADKANHCEWPPYTHMKITKRP